MPAGHHRVTNTTEPLGGTTIRSSSPTSNCAPGVPPLSGAAPDDDRGGGAALPLPTAHTCFNQLVLPAYRSQGELRERLLLALELGSEGFFLT